MPKDYARQSEERLQAKKAQKRNASDRFNPPKKKKNPVKTARSFSPKKKSDKKKISTSLKLISAIVLLIIAIAAIITFLKNTPMSPDGPPVVIAKPVNESSGSLRIQQNVQFIFNSFLRNKHSEKKEYWLQLGTFKEADSEYQALETALSSAKIHADKIKLVRLGQVYYRFQMGPYSTESAATLAQNQLEQAKIYSLVMTSHS